MGSTAVSTGEKLALTGAILGHANLRSTAIYAHVQNDPSKCAANRVSRKIAAALTGKGPTGKSRQAAQTKKSATEADNDLVGALIQRLAENGPAAARLRAAITEAIDAPKPTPRHDRRSAYEGA